MRHPLCLVTALFAVVLMSDVLVVMATNLDGQLSARMGLSSWRRPDAPPALALLAEAPPGENGGGAADRGLVPDEHSVFTVRNTAPSALGQD